MQKAPSVLELVACDIHQDFDRNGCNLHLSYTTQLTVATVAMHCVMKGVDREKAAAVVHDALVRGMHYNTHVSEKLSYSLLSDFQKDRARRVHDIAKRHHALAVDMARVLNDCRVEQEIPSVPFRLERTLEREWMPAPVTFAA